MDEVSLVGRRVDGLIDVLWQAGGTDLLLTVGIPPKVRVHGELRDIPDEAALTAADTDAILAELLSPDRAAVYAARNECDFSFDWGTEARIRGNAFRQRGATAIALRMIPADIPRPKDLGLPAVLADFAGHHQGLVLITGPTGSGKSTTLASLVDFVNAKRACHIITIEDPIEYMHKHKRATVNQREVGADTRSFRSALRSALREDPDVLLVGEMRDLESMRFVLTIAETGHLVFSTLHTNDTAQALARIIDVFPSDQQAQVRVQLAAALTGIVYQRLIPQIGGGLVAAYEVLAANSAVRNLIREGKTNQLRNCLLTGKKEGMITFERSLSALVRAGRITYEDAVARSLYPNDIERKPLAQGGVRS